MSTQIYTASREWATRPSDQRFLNIADLRESVANRYTQSWEAQPMSTALVLDAKAAEVNDDLRVRVFDPLRGEEVSLRPTNWAFGQLAGQANLGAADLRKLPAVLAAMNLMWMLAHAAKKAQVKILGQSGEGEVLRAITSPSYGRIYDLEVVDMVKPVVDNGPWVIPSARGHQSRAYATSKAGTTLYASDRDVFLFYVDETNPIVMANGEVLYRGFIVSNSEVGSAKFKVTFFLYREICENRIIWGAENVIDLEMRHTSGAPDRFRAEAPMILDRYATSATEKTVKAIEAAKNFEIAIPKPNEAEERKSVVDWLHRQGFSRTVGKAAVEMAVAEEGEAKSLWNVVQGLTAHARTIPFQNDRVELETAAGALMTKFAEPKVSV